MSVFGSNSRGRTIRTGDVTSQATGGNTPRVETPTSYSDARENTPANTTRATAPNVQESLDAARNSSNTARATAPDVQESVNTSQSPTSGLRADAPRADQAVAASQGSSQSNVQRSLAQGPTIDQAGAIIQNTPPLSARGPSRSAAGSLLNDVRTQEANATGTRITTVNIPPQRYNIDVLAMPETTITDNAFSLQQNNGLSTYRPELLNMFNFQCLYKDNATQPTELGVFVNIMQQARVLRKELIYELLSFLSAADTTRVDFANVASENLNAFYSIQNTLRLYDTNYDTISAFKHSLTVRGTIGDVKGEAYLKDIITRNMLFPLSSFEVFSETKILSQIICDLRAILENYSYELLNLVDTDRVNDVDPTKIDKTYTTTSNFTFSIESIRSTGTIKSATSEQEFGSILGALPSVQDDKIKLLLVLLSKELRISRGLSMPAVRNKLVDTYGASADGNPFDNIIGTVGDTIFDQPLGPHSLASLLMLPINDTTYVLPLEQRLINDNQRTYVPGHRYFIDNMFNNDLDVSALGNYADNFSSVVSDAKGLLSNLMFEVSALPTSGLARRPTNFSYTTSTSPLAPDRLLNTFLGSVRSSIDKTVTKDRNASNDQLLANAIFRLANSNFPLKMLLFRFLVISGINSTMTDDMRNIFLRAATELQNGSIPGINSAYLLDLNRIQPITRAAADDIQNKILDLIASDSNTEREESSASSPGGRRRSFADVEIDVSALRALLLNFYKTNLTNTTTLFKAFIDLATKIDNDTTIQGNDNNYVLSDNTGRTRFNYVSTTYLLYFVFEILASFVNKYMSAEFVTSNQRGVLGINYNTDINSTTVNLINTNPTLENASITIPAQYSYLYWGLDSITKKVVGEDQTILKFFGIMETISTALTTTSQQLRSYVSNLPKESADQLATIQQYAQQKALRLANKTWNSIAKRGVFSNKLPSSDERNALYSMLQLEDYSGLNESKLKLMTVAIPMGMTDTLALGIDRSKIRDTRLIGIKSDLIRVNIYKRSIPYDNIIFEPQSWVFDMALFPIEITGLSVHPTESFGTLLERLTLSDYSTSATNAQFVNLENVLRSNKYNSLNSNERTELFYNHITSQLLTLYVMMSCGMKINESFFIAGSTAPQYTENALQLVRKYSEGIRNVTVGNVMDALTDQQIVPDYRDELQMLLQADFLQTKNFSNQILSSKLFERLFVVPVNINDFAIDLNQTNKTERGGRTLNRMTLEIRNDGKTYIVSEPDTIIFDDYFCTIELVDT